MARRAGVPTTVVAATAQRPGTGALPFMGRVPGGRVRGSQRGIALVVTLILLSVITFLAVAFLFLSRRERGAVVTAKDMTTARLATEAGVSQAEAGMLAPMIAANNPYAYDLRGSTNYINPIGFQTGVGSLTNVNYNYANGASIGGNDLLQNIANLFYNPRPPVFVRTNLQNAFIPPDFRYYLDLNRNGRFETNGLQPEIGYNGQPLTGLDTNGNSITLSNFFVGDPEWIGILEHPDRPHSSSNKFVSRFAYIVVPSGKTLDINTIHNQAKLLGPAQDGFIRNMGVGPWELNLASFLVDLNTNYWNAGGWPNYFYNTDVAVPSSGTAFDDARDILRYRYSLNGNWQNGNWSNLRSVQTLFGGLGVGAFNSDMADGYARGPLMISNALPVVDPDLFRGNTGLSWAGDQNPNHFFTTQDFFDARKVPQLFINRLRNAGSLPNLSSYDRYTYYRLLSSLGTDSGPEPAGKLDLNYANVDANGKTVPDLQTNFQSWTAVGFFTNAADRLLRAEFPNAATNRALFNVNAPLSITNIPVLVSNQFVYTPALNRIFQLAANIYDASTNRAALLGKDLPTVFRPTFRKQANGAFTDIYIDGFTEVGSVGGFNNAVFSQPVDLNMPAEVTALLANLNNANIYGVPWVIGAKKGFPNFNEFAMQSVVQMSRKLQLFRPNTSARVSGTNQMFILGISNSFAFEAWNSYVSNYSRAVQILVTNDMTIAFNYTNDVPLDMRGSGRILRFPSGAITNLGVNAWRGRGVDSANPTKQSFVIPFQTNMLYLDDAIYRMNSGTPYFTTSTNVGSGLYYGFENTKQLQVPQFLFAITNRIRVIMLDTATGRVIDYVQLNDLDGVRDLAAEVTTANSTVTADGVVGGYEAAFWRTNRMGGNTLANAPEGVVNQIEASLGNVAVANWNSYGIGQANGATKDKEIDAFRVFMGLSPLNYPGTPNTNIVMQAPFTPTRRTSQYISWQANDPLVHFMAGDLRNLAQGNGIVRENPNGTITMMPNIGNLNDRYEPWGGNPRSSAQTVPTIPLYSVETKDPGVRSSDDWNFPTDKFPTVGWLGRVHRGTPWQTVYLKAFGVGDQVWTNWTGNLSVLDASISKPGNDRVIFDVFTTAFDENATRGQLNVNQTNLAAWSATLGGVIGLTNSSSDAELNDYPPLAKLDPFVIPPAAVDQSGAPVAQTNAPLWKIWSGVSRTRAAAPFNGYFQHLGDVLATPELTTRSPLLNTNSAVQLQNGIDDATYERLPQMLMGLLRGADQPRFEIYAYGQALHPAPRSVVTASGPYFGLCTNYQITAEFATRTVVRVDTSTDGAGKLHVKPVVESFNLLPPE